MEEERERERERERARAGGGGHPCLSLVCVEEERGLGLSVRPAEPSVSHRPQTDGGVARVRRVSGNCPRAQTPSKQASKRDRERESERVCVCVCVCVCLCARACACQSLCFSLSILCARACVACACVEFLLVCLDVAACGSLSAAWTVCSHASSRRTVSVTCRSAKLAHMLTASSHWGSIGLLWGLPET